MTNLEALLKHQREIHHPGRELGAFLLQHSNSPSYLVGQLKSYLAAAQADLDAENEFAHMMLHGLEGEAK